MKIEKLDINYITNFVENPKGSNFVTTAELKPIEILQKINELIDAFNSRIENEKEITLLRCPFCNTSAFIQSCGSHWEVGCNSDHDSNCIKPMRDGYQTKSEAISAWNNRS